MAGCSSFSGFGHLLQWALAILRRSSQQPLLHGLVSGAVGAVLAIIWVRGLFVFELALALIIASCGLFGGWLWRHRIHRRRDGL